MVLEVVFLSFCPLALPKPWGVCFHLLAVLVPRSLSGPREAGCSSCSNWKSSGLGIHLWHWATLH